MNEKQPIAPYMALGLSTISYNISKRADISRNLDNIEQCIMAGVETTNVNLPVKIVALAEGALTGFTDEVFDLSHKLCYDELFIDIPGPETERLSALARHYKTHIIVQCKARWPEVIEDRYFNCMFIIGTNGDIVHKATKNHVWCRERSCTPHDVYDRWVELFGDDIDAFYPLYCSPEIGNIGTICCGDGEYPEAVRALALNGAEVVYRPSEAAPLTISGASRGGSWMIQNQAHANFNAVYMLCPNVGPVYTHPGMEFPFDVSGGNSHMVDYRGEIVSYQTSGANSFVVATIDIEALRQFRTRNLCSNFTSQLRTELFRKMYDQPIYQKNLWLKKEPETHGKADKYYRDSINRLIDRGTYTEPFHDFEGCKYQGKAMTKKEWYEFRKHWDK